MSWRLSDLLILVSFPFSRLTARRALSLSNGHLFCLSPSVPFSLCLRFPLCIGVFVSPCLSITNPHSIHQCALSIQASRIPTPRAAVTSWHMEGCIFCLVSAPSGAVPAEELCLSQLSRWCYFTDPGQKTTDQATEDADWVLVSSCNSVEGKSVGELAFFSIWNNMKA